MKTININVYEFDELSEKAKEKVINDFRNNNDFPFLNEQLNEELKQQLEDNKINYSNLKLFYSLSYCQGDGVVFTGDFIYKDFNVYVKTTGRYNHKYTASFIIEDKATGEEINNIKIEEEFKNIFYSICDKIEKIGYSSIEYENSEEYIKESIKANEYYFRSNGEIEY
jgi:hypothetical protein